MAGEGYGANQRPALLSSLTASASSTTSGLTPMALDSTANKVVCEVFALTAMVVREFIIHLSATVPTTNDIILKFARRPNGGISDVTTSARQLQNYPRTVSTSTLTPAAIQAAVMTISKTTPTPIVGNVYRITFAGTETLILPGESVACYIGTASTEATKGYGAFVVDSAEFSGQEVTVGSTTGVSKTGFSGGLGAVYTVYS